MSFSPARASPQIDGVFHHFCDFLHGLKIAVGGGRETGFDDVDAHFVQQFGDLELFFQGHRGAGRLLAVAQGGVENDNAVCGVTFDARRFVGGFAKSWVILVFCRPAIMAMCTARNCLAVLHRICVKPLSAQHRPDGAQGRIRRSRSARALSAAGERRRAAGMRWAPANSRARLAVGSFTVATG